MGSQVVSEDRSQHIDREQLGKLREEDNDEEPATKRRNEHTDLRKKDDHVACHASVLALAMTDEACRETEM